MEYYLARKKKGLRIRVTTWMNLKGIMPTERRLKYHVLYDSIYVKFWKRHNRMYQWFPKAGGKERLLLQRGAF